MSRFVPTVPGTDRHVQTVGEAVRLAERLWRNGAWTEYTAVELIDSLATSLRVSDSFSRYPDWPESKRETFKRRAYLVLNSPQNDPATLPTPDTSSTVA